MSVLGIRSRLKSGIKRAFGIEQQPVRTESARPAPAWQAPSRPVEPEVRPVLEPETPAVEQETRAPAPVPIEEPVEARAEAPTGQAPVGSDGGDEEIRFEAVQEILDDMVRPALQGDGGDISLIKIENQSIYVRLVGACNTCPSSVMTMKMGVEALLREEFPSMKELVQVDA